MKVPLDDPGQPRDALASLPEPLDLRSLAAPLRHPLERDRDLNEAAAQDCPAADPLSPSPIR